MSRLDVNGLGCLREQDGGKQDTRALGDSCTAFYFAGGRREKGINVHYLAIRGPVKGQPSLAWHGHLQGGRHLRTHTGLFLALRGPSEGPGGTEA